MKQLKRIIEENIPVQTSETNQSHSRVRETFLNRDTISRDVGNIAGDGRTFGELMADRVAKFAGSWIFIGFFCAVLAGWVILNSWVLITNGSDFDPYPYILLNLFLSMLAAIQAPVILMSQNRQAATDRIAAAHDYEVNLKAELEVQLLHEKLDELREQKWVELVNMQQEQIELLQTLIAERPAG